jgi:biotin transport system substrate-specific component
MSTREIATAGLFAGLIAAGALIAIPIGPVPFTLQVLFVLMAGLLLRPRAALAAVAVYLLIGAIGLPVFSGGKGGLAVLVGPTGGYLVGFALAAPLVSILSGGLARRRTEPGRPGPRVAPASSVLRGVACLAGLIAIYAPGALWLARVGGFGLSKALALGTLPFLPFDLLKAVIAVVAVRALERTGVLPGSADGL